MLSINVETRGVKKLQRSLTRMQKRRLPAINAVAVKYTGEDTRDHLIERVKRIYNNNVAWYNPKAPTGIKAYKRVMQSNPFTKVWTAAWFAVLHEYGGTKTPRTARNMTIPSALVVSKARRRAGGARAALRAKKVFATKRAILREAGTKKSRRYELLYTLVKQAQIKPTLRFVESGIQFALDKYPRVWQRVASKMLKL